MNIQHILIIGSGLIGKGLALVYSACRNVRITLYDVKEDDPLEAVHQNMRQLEAYGVLSARELENRMSRISFVTDFGAPCFAQADFVAECVFEEMQLKQNLFAQLEDKCRPDAIFATNTSAMSVTEIAAKLKHKQRFVGTHFWHPAHLIPLVEVVKSDHTSEETAQATLELLESVGKVAILCKKDIPGFIGNRMQHALWREALWLLENDIADAETIDKAVRYSFGLRLPQLGPMENIDMVGADLVYNVHDYLFGHLDNATKASPILAELKDKGKLGFKTGGEGIRKWTPEEMEASRRNLNGYLIKMIYGK
jgi:3-hydroxybutyryl-CoA dehydrogenase